MSTILIKNADIVTLDAEGTIHSATDLLIDEGRIAAIGTFAHTTEVDIEIDGTGQVVMPGFFNTHCHAPMTTVRGWAEDLPFPRWLNEKIWVAESALTPDTVYWGAALAACEMIRAGIVGFNDHYFYMDKVAEVVKDSGLKALLTNCVFGIGKDKEVGDGIEDSLALISNHHGSAGGRILTAMGPHSPYVCPPEFLKEVADYAKQLNVPIHIHLAESEEQVRNSKARHGQTPVEQLEALGAFESPVIAAHGLLLSQRDIEILAQYNVTIARTPITYMKLAMPTNQLTPLMEAGIRVTFGTDGAGSNNDMDMFAAMRLDAMWEKYKALDPTKMSGDLPLRMATQQGAEALGFEGSGKIEISSPADVILVNINQAHMRPKHDLIANLVYSAKSGDVTHTIVNGELLMRDRKILTLDETDVIAQAEAAAFAMVNSDLSQVRPYDA